MFDALHYFIVVVVLCSDVFLMFLPYWKPDGIWLLFETRVRETQSHTWAGCHLQHVLPNRRSSLCSSQNVGGCSLEVWVHCRMVWGRLLCHSCSLEDGPSWFLCLSHSWFRSILSWVCAYNHTCPLSYNALVDEICISFLTCHCSCSSDVS